MPHVPTEAIKQFLFRHLHPQVMLGRASDRYAGWLEQIYTKKRYRGRIYWRATFIPRRVITEGQGQGLCP